MIIRNMSVNPTSGTTTEAQSTGSTRFYHTWQYSRRRLCEDNRHEEIHHLIAECKMKHLNHVFGLKTPKSRWGHASSLQSPERLSSAQEGTLTVR